jgi:putative ubiquitin-RnfH superfamily antitoxin RatB of RatAB toxin-antitoxin module
MFPSIAVILDFASKTPLTTTTVTPLTAISEIMISDPIMHIVLFKYRQDISLTSNDCAIYQRQQKLIKTLQAKPELSKSVRELTWTAMAVPRRLNEDCDEQDEELAHEILPGHSETRCVKDGYGGCSGAGKDLLRL